MGDVVISIETNNIGLLIERYDIFGGYFSEEELEDEEIPCIYALEILWSGADMAKEELPRKQSYTENLYMLAIEIPAIAEKAQPGHHVDIHQGAFLAELGQRR